MEITTRTAMLVARKSAIRFIGYNPFRVEIQADRGIGCDMI
jgi:hypothetical protein